MAKQKKTVGRPKKEFISQKPQKKVKSGPGRPRKYMISTGTTQEDFFPEAKVFVSKSVDESKKKDLIILLLFVFSFILFVVSLYVTFMREKKPEDLSLAEKSEIMNIQTGNIAYNLPGVSEEPEQRSVDYNQEIQNDAQEDVAAIVQSTSQEHQTILDFYAAINRVDMDTIYVLTDARLEESNVFKTYYSKRWLKMFSESVANPKIVVSNIQEVSTESSNPNIKQFDYTIEYELINTQQKFTEERSTTLIKKGEHRRVGRLMCETKGCSTMPFFNTEKYK